MKVTDLQLKEMGQPRLQQILRIMKFTMLLLLVGSMHVYADGFSQSKLSLRLQQADLKRALILIEKQSSVRFLYNQNILKNVGKVSVEVNNEALVKVLNEILDGTGISYKILEDDLVVLNFDEEFFVPADAGLEVGAADMGENGFYCHRALHRAGCTLAGTRRWVVRSVASRQRVPLLTKTDSGPCHDAGNRTMTEAR